jgi:hypothetical protein
VVNKSVWADIDAASTSSTNTNILVLLVMAAPIYWCYDVRSTKMAKLKTKRTSITTIGAKIQAFNILQTPP